MTDRDKQTHNGEINNEESQFMRYPYAKKRMTEGSCDGFD